MSLTWCSRRTTLALGLPQNLKLESV